MFATYFFLTIGKICTCFASDRSRAEVNLWRHFKWRSAFSGAVLETRKTNCEHKLVHTSPERKHTHCTWNNSVFERKCEVRTEHARPRWTGVWVWCSAVCCEFRLTQTQQRGAERGPAPGPLCSSARGTHEGSTGFREERTTLLYTQTCR